MTEFWVIAAVTALCLATYGLYRLVDGLRDVP